MLKKFLLILFGLALSLLLLELVLQSTSVVIKLYKNHLTNQELHEKNSVTILCLGESTTDRQWPRFLKQSLIKRNVKKEITVIDKGIRAINTTCILTNTEEYIEKFKPDIIVSMMGINDGNSDVIALNNLNLKHNNCFF